MAHNIATIDGKAAMFFHGKTPWHGLGTKLDGPATSAEAIKAAKLDWRVVKVPLLVEAGRHSYATVQDKFAMVRSDTPVQSPVNVLGVVGKDYTPLQNRDAFGWFDSIVGEDEAVYHTAGALGDGERVWILAKLPGEIQVTSEDVADKFLLLSNSHDGKSSVQVKFTPIRVVCQNTLTMALNQGRSLKIAHTASLEQRMNLAKWNLGIINTRFTEIADAFKAMAKVEMAKDRLARYLGQVFPEPEDKENKRSLARVLKARSWSEERFAAGRGNNLAGVSGTLWAAYNGVAEYVDYKLSGRTEEGRLDHVWFGDGYLCKVRAYRAAVALTKEWLN